MIYSTQIHAVIASPMQSGVAIPISNLEIATVALIPFLLESGLLRNDV